MHHAITLEALRVLEAIHLKGSFAGAAKSLFKVPSALTYTMQKLESDLDVALFDRKGQRAALTSAGIMLLNEGRHILDAADDLEQKIKQIESGWETQLTIAKDTIIEDPALFNIIQRFCQLDKHVNVTVFEEALGGAWEALHLQRSHIAIGVTGDVPKGQYHVHEMGQIEFVFCVANHHPLADYVGVLEAPQISQYPAIIVADSARNMPQRSSGLFDSKQSISVQNMTAKLYAQQQGLGVGFLPLHIVEPALNAGTMVAKATSLHRPPVPVFMAWKKDNKGKALNWFVEQCQSQKWF